MREIQKAMIKEKLGLINRDIKRLSESKSISEEMLDNLNKHYSSLFDIVSYINYDNRYISYEIVAMRANGHLAYQEVYLSVRQLVTGYEWKEIERITGFELKMEDEE